jgi:hypothetical protein
MKRQETKKLTLSRETVRNLEGRELAAVEGGFAQIAPIVSSDNRACSYSRAC